MQILFPISSFSFLPPLHIWRKPIATAGFAIVPSSCLQACVLSCHLKNHAFTSLSFFISPPHYPPSDTLGVKPPFTASFFLPHCLSRWLFFRVAILCSACHYFLSGENRIAHLAFAGSRSFLDLWSQSFTYSTQVQSWILSAFIEGGSGKQGRFRVPIPWWSSGLSSPPPPLSFTACIHLLTECLPRASSQQTKVEVIPPSSGSAADPTLLCFSLPHSKAGTLDATGWQSAACALPFLSWTPSWWHCLPIVKGTPSAPPSLLWLLWFCPAPSIWILIILLLSGSENFFNPKFPNFPSRKQMSRSSRTVKVSGWHLIPSCPCFSRLVYRLSCDVCWNADAPEHLCFEDTPGGFWFLVVFENHGSKM